MIAENFSCEKDNLESHTIEEAMRRLDWPKWKATIEEYASLGGCTQCILCWSRAIK